MAASKPPKLTLIKDSEGARKYIRKMGYDTLYNKAPKLRSVVGGLVGSTHPSATVINKAMARILPKVLNYQARKEVIANKLRAAVGKELTAKGVEKEIKLDYESAKKIVSLFEAKHEGLSPEQITKNLRLAKRFAQTGMQVRPKHAGEIVRNKAEKIKEKLLMKGTPGYDNASGNDNKNDNKKSIGNLIKGPWGGGAQDLTEKGDLQVETHKGGTGFSGGKPQGGIASIEEARKKKAEKKQQADSKDHDNLSQQIPFAKVA